MGKLRILDANGDTCTTYDAEKAEVGDLDAQDAVRAAEKIFKEHKERGFTAFKTGTEEPAIRIDVFDSRIEITMVPRVAGGR